MDSALRIENLVNQLSQVWTTGISCPSYNIWMPIRFGHDIITEELKKEINLKLLHKIFLY